MAAIFNLLCSFSGRHLSRLSNSSSLPVNHLIFSGASKTISLESSERGMLFTVVVKISNSCCIKALLTSKLLQRLCTFCVISRHIPTSLLLVSNSSAIISCLCSSSLHVISMPSCFFWRESMALSSSVLRRSRVLSIRLFCSLCVSKVSESC